MYYLTIKARQFSQHQKCHWGNAKLFILPLYLIWTERPAFNIFSISIKYQMYHASQWCHNCSAVESTRVIWNNRNSPEMKSSKPGLNLERHLKSEAEAPIWHIMKCLQVITVKNQCEYPPFCKYSIFNLAPHVFKFSLKSLQKCMFSGDSHVSLFNLYCIR